MIFETHAHYDDEQFDEDRDELLHSMKDHGIGTIVNVGSTMDTSRWTVNAVKKYPFLYGAVGVHPNETGQMTDEDLKELKEYTKREKIIAIGEIGLDYYWKEPSKQIQQKWFREQIILAQETKLPMLIHSRDATKDTYDMLHELHGEKTGGVIHCFSGSVEMARKYLDMGFYIGVGGVVTFKNAKTLKEVVQDVPLTSILLETDCPYLAPEPNRGKRNSSLNLPFVAQEIARLKEITTEQVIRTTWENAQTMFHMKED